MAEWTPEQVSEALNETADLIEELPLPTTHKLAEELRALGDLVKEDE